MRRRPVGTRALELENRCGVSDRELSAEVQAAAKLVATVVGQDLDQTDGGTFRILRGVAPDRVISTVDPETRHGHKTAALEHSFDSEIGSAIEQTRRVYAVPASLVRGVIKQESAFQPKVLSKCGARGLMQVMPFNAMKLGVANEDELWVPRLNVLAGVRLLAVLLKHYDGDVIATLVAYNSGPKSKDVPLLQNGETPGYVLNILRSWRASAEARSYGR